MTSELLGKATRQNHDVVSVKLLTSFLCDDVWKLLWKFAEPRRVEFNLFDDAFNFEVKFCNQSMILEFSINIDDQWQFYTSMTSQRYYHNLIANNVPRFNFKVRLFLCVLK